MSGVGAVRRHIWRWGGDEKGGKKYIIYVLLRSYVILNFYPEGVCKHKCITAWTDAHKSIRDITERKAREM